MFGHKTRSWVIVVAAVLGACVSSTQAVNIDMVTVGNKGNAPDMRYAAWPGQNPLGYGAVAYTYKMGKFEITAGQYCEFLNAVAKTDTYGLYNTKMADTITYGIWGCNIQRSGTSGSYSYSVASDWANRPVNYVSWGHAARFCNWLTNGQPTGNQGLSTTEDGSYCINGETSYGSSLSRKANARYVIPSEDEWYKAAYYKSGSTNAGYWDYPTSSDSAPGRDMADVSGNNANYYGNPYPIDSPCYSTVVGEFQNSDSPYGTFDQGGNVLEWNEALFYNYYRGLRGGSWFHGDVEMSASYRGFYQDPSVEGANLGFRIVEVPEPGCLGLLGIGIMLVCRWRRRSGESGQ